VDAETVWGARAALTFKPMDRLRIDLSYAAQGVNMNGEPGVQPRFGDYTIQRPLDLYSRGADKEDERIGQFVGAYDFDAATLTSASSYTQMKRYTAQDIGFLAVAAGYGPQLWPLLDRSKGESFTQELRMQSRGAAPLQWLLGYYYSNANFDLSQQVPDYS